MSYARVSGDSDVYVFMSVFGHLECCGCLLQKYEYTSDVDAIGWPVTEPVEPFIQTEFYATQDMIDHLQSHREAGHTIPDGIEDRLWRDDVRNFPPEESDHA